MRLFLPDVYAGCVCVHVCVCASLCMLVSMCVSV